MAVAAIALGIDFVSGQAIAAFYAQMGSASWLGIGVSAVLFGMLTGMLVRRAQRCGVRGIREMPQRLPGGAGKGMVFLYACILLLAAGMLVNSACRMGALAVPVRRGDLLGGALALLAAGALALGGGRALRRTGAALAVLLAAFELGLLLFARLPDAPRFGITLHLRGNRIAALAFAGLYTSACLCLSAGPAVRLCAGRANPGRVGVWAGAAFGLLLGLGNAVLLSGDERLLALKLPFVALAADWGKAGFYLSAGLNWSLNVFCLSGLLYGVLSARHGAIRAGK